jgi:hypothetical protein
MVFVRLKTRAIVAFQNVPRFGHSNDFVNLFKTRDDAVDYCMGLLFAGVLVATLFVTWTLLLAIFRCIGPKRLGFWAGGRFVSNGYGSQVARTIFVLSSLILLIFSILFVTEGLTDLRNTVVTTIDSADVSTFHRHYVSYHIIPSLTNHYTLPSDYFQTGNS